MDINVNLSGLDALAASIESLAEALKAGVTANQIIDTAKQSSRKPRTPSPAAAPVVDPGNDPASGPTDTATPATPASTAPAAETPAAVPEPSKPAAPSKPEPVAAHEAEAAAFNVAAQDGKPTIAQVRAAIAKLAQTDKARALEILSKRGAASVSALAEEHYAAALAEASK